MNKNIATIKPWLFTALLCAIFLSTFFLLHRLVSWLLP